MFLGPKEFVSVRGEFIASSNRRSSRKRRGEAGEDGQMIERKENYDNSLRGEEKVGRGTRTKIRELFSVSSSQRAAGVGACSASSLTR